MNSLNVVEVWRYGFCSVWMSEDFDDSLEFGRRRYWRWMSVYAGDVVWEGYSDDKWQAIADSLFRFRCVAGWPGDGRCNARDYYIDIVDAGLSDPCA